MEMFLQHVKGTFERPAQLVLGYPALARHARLPADGEEAGAAAARRGHGRRKCSTKSSEKVASSRAPASTRPPPAGSTAARPRRLDETDRDAARMLLQARRKRCEEDGAVLSPGLVQAVALAAVLAGLRRPGISSCRAAECGMFVRPRSATPPKDRISATSEACQRYLSLYRDQTTSRAAAGARPGDQASANRAREEQLHNRIYGKLRKPSGEPRRPRPRALESEDAGDLPRRRRNGKSSKWPSKAKPTGRRSLRLGGQEAWPT